MPPPDTDSSLWIHRFHAGVAGSVRLACFPHAGGSAGFYFSFSAALPPGIEVLAIQYPGRQDRRHEPFIPTIGALADTIAGVLCTAAADQPLALFGHSMGALVAYEVARRVEAAGRTLAGLFVSGRVAPSTPRPGNVHTRSDAGILAELQRLNGTESAVLEDQELVQMILPAVRNDYRALETYTHQPGAELTCRIAALVGDADPVTTVDDIDAWRQHTSGEFTRHVFPGGHFYLSGKPSPVVNLISDRLLPTPLSTSRHQG